MSEIIPPECWTCLVCQRAFGVGDGAMAGVLICRDCVGLDIDEARKRNLARLEAEAEFLATHDETPPEEQVENTEIQNPKGKIPNV